MYHPCSMGRVHTTRVAWAGYTPPVRYTGLYTTREVHWAIHHPGIGWIHHPGIGLDTPPREVYLVYTPREVYLVYTPPGYMGLYTTLVYGPIHHPGYTQPPYQRPVLHGSLPYPAWCEKRRPWAQLRRNPWVRASLFH